jgi:hypothetical protein
MQLRDDLLWQFQFFLNSAAMSSSFVVISCIVMIGKLYSVVVWSDQQGLIYLMLQYEEIK